jgi:hypothetical protein
MITRWTGQETRFGPRSAGAWRSHRPQTDMQAEGAVPTSKHQCVHPGTAASLVEFIVESANGVTAYTVHYGRWVELPETPTGAAVERPIELGTVAVTGAADEELFRIEFPSYGDYVWLYVDTFTGSASEDFRFFMRALE